MIAGSVGIALALWRVSRPSIWMVSLLPLWFGHLLATRELFPGKPWPLVAAAVVMGPLVWGAALAINDACDLASDRQNPRKATTPVVQGRLSPDAVLTFAYSFAAAALLLAATVGLALVALTASFLALAWAYSMPPIRLKTRPGADVATNALGVGGIPLLAGWCVARTLGEFPWPFLGVSLAVAAALYIPTTLVDHDADLAAGEATLATRLGPRGAYRIGLAFWALAATGTVALAAADLVVPRSMLVPLGVLVPVLVTEYHCLIGRAASPQSLVRGIVALSTTFLVPTAVFALLYTGTFHVWF